MTLAQFILLLSFTSNKSILISKIKSISEYTSMSPILSILTLHIKAWLSVFKVWLLFLITGILTGDCIHKQLCNLGYLTILDQNPNNNLFLILGAQYKKDWFTSSTPFSFLFPSILLLHNHIDKTTMKWNVTPLAFNNTPEKEIPSQCSNPCNKLSARKLLCYVRTNQEVG